MYPLPPLTNRYPYRSAARQPAVAISCPVYSSSSVDWISFLGPQPQYGSGTVYYSLSSNSGAKRQTNVTVANQPFTVTQDAGDSCDAERQKIIQDYIEYDNVANTIG